MLKIENYTKPDVILKLSENQLDALAGLMAKMLESGGAIAGSVNIDGYLAVSLLPTEIAEKMIAFANEKTDEGALPKLEVE